MVSSRDEGNEGMHQAEIIYAQLVDEVAALRQRIAELETQLQNPERIPAEDSHVGVAMDVTQRTEKELLGQERQRFIESIIAVAPGVIYLHEVAEQRVTVLSSQTLEVLGYTSTEFQALVGNGTLSLIHPDDRARVAKYQQELAQAPAGQVMGITYRLPRKDGTWNWCLSHEVVFLRNADGQVTQVVGVGLDIDERQRAELERDERQRFIERIIAITPGVIYLHDLLEQRSIVLTPQNLAILGYTSAEFQGVAGIGGYLHIHPDDRSRILEYFRKLDDATDGQVGSIEYRIKHKDGTWRWALSHDTVFSRTAEGKVHQMLGVAVNINVRKQAEEALQALSHRLLQVQERERQYLARELHEEIGQSLTALLMHLQVLETELAQSSGGPPLQDNISLIQTMVSQVRNLSLDLRPPMLDNLGLVEALRWYLRRQSQHTGISMDLFATGAGIRPDRVIEETCFRVVQEAITNAVRHANAQNVWVELQQTEEALELSVHDDGKGFDLDGTHREPKVESGIGLLGMEERLRQIGGRLVIQSTLGEGTDVQITVPLQERMK